MLVHINRVFIIALGFISLLFFVIVLSLKFNLSPQQIEYNETKEFLSNLSYNKGDFPSSCLVDVNGADYCSFRNLLIYPNYLDISSNFNCSLYVNNTYFAPGSGGIEGPQPYNSTHNMIGCKYSLSPYSAYCNESNSYTFIFSFNATPLPQREDTNIVILNNLSYYDGTTYKPCNISYNYTFMAAPLGNLDLDYISLNSSRTFDKNNLVAYAYLDDVFVVRVNASNIRDAKHSGKLKYAWVNITSLPPNIISLNSTSRYIGNISSGSYSIEDFWFRPQSIATSNVEFNFSDYTTFYSSKQSITIVVQNFSFISSPSISIINGPSDQNIVEFGNSSYVLRVSVMQNATKIENITAVLTNIDRNEQYYITLDYDSCTTSIYEYYCTYNKDLTTLPSGRYKIRTYAYAGKQITYDGIANPYSQEVDFIITGGVPSIEAHKPLYYILKNQTFIYNITLTPLKGDLYQINVSIDSDYLTYSNKTHYIPLLQNGTTYTLKGYLTSPPTTKRAKTIINITYYNLTHNITKSFTLFHNIIEPQIVLPNNTYVGNTTTIKAYIAGVYDASLSNVEITINRTLTQNITTKQLVLENITTTDYCFSLSSRANANIIGDATAKSSNTDDAELTRDSNTLTSWSGAQGDYLIYTFPYERDLGTIRFYARSLTTTSTLQIKGVSSSREETTTLQLNTTKTWYVAKLNGLYDQVNISISSGSASIYEIEVYETFKNETCYVYSAPYTIENSGINIVILTTTDSKSNITTSNASFFVNYGVVKYTPLNTVFFAKRNDTLRVNITAIYGDVKDINVSLIFPEKEKINTTDIKNTSLLIPLLLNSNTITTYWDVYSYADNQTNANITLNLSSITQNLLENITVSIFVNDTQEPYYLGYSQNHKKGSLNYPYYLTLYVSEDIKVMNITATLKTPDNNTYNITNKYDIYSYSGANTSLTFKIPEKYLNQTGNYTIQHVYVSDVFNMTNNETNISFEITDMLYYSIEHSIYNYGQDMEIRVFTVNNIQTSEGNINVVFIKDNATFTLYNATYQGKTTIRINQSLPQGQYKAQIYAYSRGNEINKTTYINITSKIKHTLISPEVNTIAVNTKFTLAIKMNYANGENISAPSSILFVNASCSNQSIALDPTYYYYQHEGDLVFFTRECLSPSNEGNFEVRIDAQDIYNNTLEENLRFYAFDPVRVVSSSSQQQQTIVSESGGGGEPQIIYVNTSNETVKIVYANLSTTKIFTITIPKPVLDGVKQGENITTNIIVSNKANISYEVLISIDEGIFNIDYPSKILLESNVEKTIPIEISVPLSAKEGEYTVLINASSEDVPLLQKIIYVVVVEAEYIKEFKELLKEIKELNKSIEIIKLAGLDASKEEHMLKKLEEAINKINESIVENNLTGLISMLSLSKSLLEETSSNIKTKELIAKISLNKWEIFGYVFLAIISFIFIFLWIAPLGYVYFRIFMLRRRAYAIKSERIRVEMEYFRRKIDEYTYRAIMAKEEQELNHIRAMLDDYKTIRRELIRFKILSIFKLRKPKPKKTNNKAPQKIKAYTIQELQSIKNKVVFG